jgi:hypothetical protein
VAGVAQLVDLAGLGIGITGGGSHLGRARALGLAEAGRGGGDLRRSTPWWPSRSPCSR